jgi:hypothetical protein
MYVFGRHLYQQVSEKTVSLLQIRHNAIARIDAIKTKKRFCMAGSNTRLVPWKEGKLVMSVAFQFGCPPDHSAFSTTQVMQVLSAASLSSNAQLMIKNSLEGAKLHLPEAQYMLDGLNQISDNVVGALAYILPGMMTVIEAQQLLKIGIKTEFKLLRELKRVLGATFNPMLGYFTGYYRLDLLKENDRRCFFMLLQRSASLYQLREKKQLWDISQNGDCSCFRNTNFFQKPTRKLGEKISIETFYPLPARGIVEFDFCDWDKPNIHLDRPINDSKVIGILSVCRLVKSEKQLQRAHDRLQEMRVAAKMMIRESGYRYWKMDAGRAIAVADYLHEMYTHRARGFEKRYSSLRKSKKKEKIGEKKDPKDAGKDDEEGSDGSGGESDGETEGEAEGGEKDEEGEGGATEAESDALADTDNMMGIDSELGASLDTMDAGSVDSGSAGDAERPSSQAGSPGKKTRLANVVMAVNLVKGKSSPVPASEHSGEPRTESRVESRPESRAGTSASSAPGSADPASSRGGGKKPQTAGKSKDKDEDAGKSLSEIAMAAASSSSSVTLRRQMREFDALLASKRATNENKCLIIMEYIESSLLGRRLYCRQLALIMEFFKIGRTQKSNLGSYRVELVINAFHRILDLNNFELVLMVLTAREHAAVIARLGWLAIFNPCKPEGYYELDLTRWEERHLFKMLIQLSFAEKSQCKLFIRNCAL